MDRTEALKAVTDNVKNQNLIKHMLATESIMRALASKFGENADEWGLAGLLHDIDLEILAGDMKDHGKLSAQMAKKMGVKGTIAHAIICHNSAHGVACESLMDKALLCSDPLTGLITAGALIRPEKKLSAVQASSISKRFKEKSFAAGANREQIASCATLGLTLDEFISLGLSAMQSISSELGL
jgi:putative nucleotidyltransferase with HDIG domain